MCRESDLRNVISECCCDVLFIYNGTRAGVTSTVINYVPLFQVWYGQVTKEYRNIDELMTDPFFDGKSLSELVDIVEFSYA